MTDPDLRAALAAAQRQAMRERDRPLLSVLRSASSAIANAEAVAIDTLPRAGAAEAAAVGVGAADAERRILAVDEIAAVVGAEIADLLQAAAQYEAAGQSERAADLRRGADALNDLLDQNQPAQATISDRFDRPIQ